MIDLNTNSNYKHFGTFETEPFWIVVETLMPQKMQGVPFEKKTKVKCSSSETVHI